MDLPHNYPAHCVAYPGTHDNNTLRGWLENETTPAQRKQAKAYFALTEQEGEITGLLRGVLASPAELAIVTMADWLEKGSVMGHEKSIERLEDIDDYLEQRPVL